jgi:hypothetical protein
VSRGFETLRDAALSRYSGSDDGAILARLAGRKAEMVKAFPEDDRWVAAIRITGNGVERVETVHVNLGPDGLWHLT